MAFAPKDYTQEMLTGLLDNIKEDRTDLDLLFDCMLRWGVELSMPLNSTKVDGCTIHNVMMVTSLAASMVLSQRKSLMLSLQCTQFVSFSVTAAFRKQPTRMNLFELFKQKCNWTDEEVRKNVRVI